MTPDLDAIEARIAAVSEPLHAEARMSAYYYEFNRTGVGVIDAVLSAVAVAGKGAHHTEDWNDVSDYGYYDERPGLPTNPPGFDTTIGSNGGSAIALIQRTANASAETVRGMFADHAALVTEVKRLREDLGALIMGGAPDPDEVRALRAVAEASAVLTGDPDDPAWRKLSDALDALLRGAK